MYYPCVHSGTIGHEICRYTESRTRKNVHSGSNCTVYAIVGSRSDILLSGDLHITFLVIYQKSEGKENRKVFFVRRVLRSFFDLDEELLFCSLTKSSLKSSIKSKQAIPCLFEYFSSQRSKTNAFSKGKLSSTVLSYYRPTVLPYYRRRVAASSLNPIGTEKPLLSPCGSRSCRTTFTNYSSFAALFEQ